MIKNQSINKILKKRTVQTIIFVLVFVFTFILRAHEYDRVPTAGHLDEQLYALSGLNLIETGVPVSWSTLEYPKEAEVFKGEINFMGGAPQASVTLYKPWLDEPPLFSLLVGTFAKLYGADRDGFIPASYIRLPVVLISSLTSIFIFLVARSLSGFYTGILAMSFYGLTPTFVIGSRTAMPENLIALSLMLVIYLLIRYQKKLNFKFLLPIPFIVGLSGLSKPTGYFLLPVVLYLVVFFLPQKERKLRMLLSNGKLWYLVLATIPFVLAYFIYGYHFDWEIFKRIFSIQSMRPVGFGSLAWLLISPSFATNIFKDSWYVFALITGIYYLIIPKEGISRIISIALVFWFLVIMFTGGEGDLLAWYRYPLFPLLSITAAWGFEYLFSRADLYATFLTVGLLLGNRPLLVTSLNKNVRPIIYRMAMIFLLLPSALQQVYKNDSIKIISRLIILGVFVAGALYNTIYIYNAFDIVCEGTRCPIVPQTFLSKLYFPFFWRFLVINTTPNI